MPLGALMYYSNEALISKGLRLRRLNAAVELAIRMKPRFQWDCCSVAAPPEFMASWFE